MSNLQANLECPILLTLFVEPISMPCCGRAISREAVVQHFETDDRCPLCRAQLSDFDPETATLNRDLNDMVELVRHSGSLDPTSISANTPVISSNTTPTPIWSCQAIQVHASEMYQLNLKLEHAPLMPKPTLLILVVDKSGSMSGNPWNQVKRALLEIVSQTSSNTTVKTVIITYDYAAQIVDVTPNQAEMERRIHSISAGGGTQFMSAFHKIGEVLAKHKCSDQPEDAMDPYNVSMATIVFLTDGESGDNISRDQLVSEFKIILDTKFMGPVCVHSVGFSGGCDSKFLEKMWRAGSIPGTFRYTEPGDHGDTLGSKLTVLTDAISKNSTVQSQIKISNFEFRMPMGSHESFNSNLDLRFPITTQGMGECILWARCLLNSPATVNPEVFVQIGDTIYTVPIEIITPDGRIAHRINQQWLSVLVDDLAAEILELSAVTERAFSFALRIALLRQRTAAISSKLDSQGPVRERFTTIISNLDAMRQGSTINMGRLGDLRFGQHYQAVKPVPSEIPEHRELSPQIPIMKARREACMFYSRCNTNKKRSQLESLIADSQWDFLTNEIQSCITSENVTHLDADGNTALMLAAYCGHSTICQAIIDFCNQNGIEHIDSVNKSDHESAVTMAIKKRGFYRTLRVLLKAGHSIPISRCISLTNYCLEMGYTVTADCIAASGTECSFDRSMSETALRMNYHKASEQQIKIDLHFLLEIAFAKGFEGLLDDIVSNHAAYLPAIFTQQNALNSVSDLILPVFYPAYSSIFTKILPFIPDIEMRNSQNETMLFKAAEKGCLEHVRALLSIGANIECVNYKGNTPLWIASCNLHLDVVTELITAGANVSATNLKGDIPLTPICQRGSLDIASLLVANGADVNHLNKNRDSLVLMCCRNGQADVLRFLLDQVNPEIRDHAAPIDGFNPVMAAAESNRALCIRVLHEYKYVLDSQTSDDNAILRRATALHIAAYYGRTAAARTLLELGAEVNAVDFNRSTPLHMAVVQNMPEMVLILKNAGADMMALDNLNNTPFAYCRGAESSAIYEALADPAFSILMCLARGEADNETDACNILRKYTGAPACLSIAAAINVSGPDGTTPLIEAVINSNYLVIRTLLELGADLEHRDLSGMTAQSWAVWIGNNRCRELLVTDSYEPSQSYLRLQEASKSSSNSKTLLYLALKPRIQIRLPDVDGLLTRMRFISEFRGQMSSTLTSKPSCALLTLFGENTRNNKICLYEKADDFKSLIWSAKVATAKCIARGVNQGVLNAEGIMSLYMYLASSALSSRVHRACSQVRLVTNLLSLTWNIWLQPSDLFHHSLEKYIWAFLNWTAEHISLDPKLPQISYSQHPLYGVSP